MTWKSNLAGCVGACLAAPLVVLGTALIFSPIILFVWATITYGQGKHGTEEECRARFDENGGFVGNPDFYGLGIRLGVYFQWLATVVATVALKSERKTMIGAYLGFSVALYIAVLLQIFLDGCVFTVEMIILLNILWGGVYLTSLPYIATIARPKDMPWDTWFDRWGGSTFVVFPLLLCLIPVTEWFWIRLAIYGEVDFEPSPEGTTFFLMSHVQPSGVAPASKFMAVIFIWLCSGPVLKPIQRLIAAIPRLGWFAKLFFYVTPTGVSTLAVLALAGGMGFVIGLVGMTVAQCMDKGDDFEAWLDAPDINLFFEDLAYAEIGLVIAIVSIVATELTLRWNNVSEVNTVQDTGQVIPLVVGAGICINVVWKLVRRRKNEANEKSIIQQGMQLEDGTWQ